MAHGHQSNPTIPHDIEFNAKDCFADQVLTIKLYRAFDIITTCGVIRPTIHLGFFNGLMALAEELIVEESVDLYKVLTSFTIDLFGVPKYYRGKIRIRDNDYDLIIYESHFVPDTDQTYLLKK